MTDRLVVSVVSPVYCEEASIGEFHRRLAAVMDSLAADFDHEILYVNDGSTDGSLALLRKLAADDPHVKLVDFSRNFGHQTAITAGIDHAIGDAVVVIDSDLQDPPEVVSQMVERWREGNKVVYGVRTQRNGESVFKRATARVHYAILDRLSDVSIPRHAGDFRLMDRAVVDVLRSMREESRYIRGMVSWAGFRQCGVEYERDARFAGRSAYTFRKMFGLARDGITGFSERPLRIATNLGVLTTLIGFGLGLYVVTSELLRDANSIRGWTSLMAAVLFLGGVQLLCVGVIGEYVGRLHREAKHRPLYVVAERVNLAPPDPRTPVTGSQ